MSCVSYTSGSLYSSDQLYFQDFQSKDGSFDISKIPDIFDNIKYDVQHNSKLGLKNTIRLYSCVKPLADLIVPQVCCI